jgi:hypothetical protein
MGENNGHWLSAFLNLLSSEMTCGAETQCPVKALGDIKKVTPFTVYCPISQPVIN